MTSLFKRMGGTYTLGTDGMYYPDVVSTDEEPHYGKYGRMRKQYLKGHRPAVYYTYLLEDRLTAHLNALDDEAHERIEALVRQMMEKQGITEELKARDQMEWVGAVNNIRNAAEEIVLDELIYREQKKLNRYRYLLACSAFIFLKFKISIFLLWFTRLMMPSFLLPGFLPGTCPENIGIFPYTAINVIRVN